jgi:hypothetical protein
MPSMHELATIARNLASATSLLPGVLTLQRDVGKLLRASDVLCIWIDWPRGIAYCSSGRVSPQVHELVTQVAGSGRRSHVGGALVEPLGAAPARAVLALRRPSGAIFTSHELTILHTLAAGLAPVLDRLLAIDRAQLVGIDRAQLVGIDRAELVGIDRHDAI